MVPLRHLDGEVEDVIVSAVVVCEDEALDAVVGEAADAVHDDAEEGVLAQRDGPPETHMVGRVAGPDRVEGDAVAPLRDLVDEVSCPQGVHSQGEVGAVLLDGAYAHDHDGCGVVVQPVLEGGAGQLPQPELAQFTVLGQ